MLVGTVLIVLALIPDKEKTGEKIMLGFGTTLLGVFGVSLVYEVFVAEKHFEDFKNILEDKLKGMDLIQSKCIKLGVNEIFETRHEYELKYPFGTLVDEAPPNSKIRCVARSLFVLTTKEEAFKNGLVRGLSFELACVDPNLKSPIIDEVWQQYDTDTASALTAVKRLMTWAVSAKPKGSFELRYHQANSLDSALVFMSKNREEKLVWDLSFGRSMSDKKVIITDTACPLGAGLKSRYDGIYRLSTCQIRYANGSIECNNLGWKL